jgi:hypothetical protein
MTEIEMAADGKILPKECEKEKKECKKDKDDDDEEDEED